MASDLNKLLNGVIISLKITLVALTGIILGLFLSLVPMLHENLLISTVSPSIVKIMPIDISNQGGTGFLLGTKRGPMVITNAHICRLFPTKLVAVYDQAHSEPRLAHVLKISDLADLCILSGFEDIPTLSLGSPPKRGSYLAALGHPLLAPVTFTSGRLVSEQIVRVPEDLVTTVHCFGGSLLPDAEKLGCTRAYNAYNTTLSIFPGNSGSPVVNAYGNVVGVVFRTNLFTKFGSTVTFYDLKKFLEEFEK